MVNEYTEVIGKTIISLEINNFKDEILFIFGDETKYKMSHCQGCCEEVTIEDINGDIQDLIGNPLLMAEEELFHQHLVTNKDDAPKEDYHESHTWTFYKFATIKGSVTIRWYGHSNGCYSELVNFEKI